jgi:ABC-2 type transport system permease protein
MAVYRRTYRPYSGRFTSSGSRFLVLTRYGLKSLLDSRPLLAFFVACNIPFLLFMLFIYVNHSPAAQALLNVKGALVNIDNFFFMKYLVFQGTLCFLITSWVGPGLVSADLSNDALPLYFARPFSRTEYVLGKFSVIATLLSAITWVPGLILIAFQADLAGWTWFSKYYWLIGSMLLGAWLWIGLLSLMSLAISAWVKWKIVSSSMMLGVFFALAGFGEALDQILRSHWGKLFNLGHLISVAWLDLFRVERFSVRDPHGELPAPAAWIAILGFAALSLLLLNRKLKAREVVR